MIYKFCFVKKKEQNFGKKYTRLVTRLKGLAKNLACFHLAYSLNSTLKISHDN
jgi:hypothetical protein